MARKDFYNISQMKERGWTASIIKKLVQIEPTEFRGMYRRQPQKCYPKDYIEGLEQSDEFKELREKASQRSTTMSLVAEKKRTENIEKFKKRIYAVKVPVLPLDVLRRRTIDAKNKWYEYTSMMYDRFDDGPVDERNLDNSTLFRWEVNFIRHELTKYEDLLSEIYGIVGTHEIYKELKNYVLDRISEAYPHLKGSCDSQKIQKSSDLVAK